MDDINVPIFSQAKLEYTKQLVDLLYMNMYDGVRSIYDDAKLLYLKKRLPITSVFRTLLEQVPKWNSDIIETETVRIEKASKCDWLDDLLTAVFISHTRILMSIGSNHNFNKINVTIPKTTTFVHKSYINIAREVWKNPYLFDDQLPGHEYQRNMKQLEDTIKLTIEDTIRRQLPIKEILREHLESNNEPKPQPQLDMKTLVEEIRKASITNKGNDNQDEPDYVSDIEETSEIEDNVEDNVDDVNNTNLTTNLVSPKLSSMFTKEEDSPKTENFNSLNNEQVINNPVTAESIPISIPASTPTNSFKDSDDPDEDQIKKATQNIVLYDITEPVVEQTYDNVDLVSPTKNNTNSDDKLNSMIKELSMDVNKPVDTSIVKIDKLGSPKSVTVTPEITKLSDTKLSDTKLSDTKLSDTKLSDTNKPTIIKSDTTVSDTTVVKKENGLSPFSFDNLYSSITGKGKVEEVKVDETNKPEDTNKSNTIIIKEEPIVDKPKSTQETNADIMKEVISLDKKEEQIDETKSLDIFFSDIQKMADPSMNPMEPIKEETKYTLFEDAKEKE
jgi:hypothetical protein